MKTTFFIYSKWLLCVALLLWQGIAFAQAPAIVWQKSLGGSDVDLPSSIQQTTDGGYIMAGRSISNDGDVTGNHGGYDSWIVKLDSNGTLSWQKCLGGSGYEEANSIQQTTDGGYIVAGSSGSIDGDVTGNHGGSDYWIIKLDANGNLSWQKCFGGSGTERAFSIQQTKDGGYIVAGLNNYNNGDVTGHHGSYDYWIVKLDTSGYLTWQKSLGGYNDDRAYSIQQTTDGSYIVAGFSRSIDGDVTGNYGSEDYWIVKLDSNGYLTWQKNLGGSSFDDAYSIQQTIDGGYIVAGLSGSNDGDVSGNLGHADYWIVKLDTNGNLSWQKCLGGSVFDEAYSIQQTIDGGYIVAGNSLSNNGDVTGNHGNKDYWIVKLKEFGVGIDEANMLKNLSVSPNPVVGNSISLDYYLSAATAVEISMINVVGKRVAYIEREIEAEGVQSRVIEVGHLASGLYFLELRTEYGRETVRWVKE